LRSVKEDSSVPGYAHPHISGFTLLHPDEGAALLPFNSLERARFCKDWCDAAYPDLQIGVLGGEYISIFFHPQKILAAEVKDTFQG